ncbi:5681_t:CDS:10 [Paraglomus brasilianum]|uniref:Ubiquitin carboxyl-terminal hydrolase 14 n=1 Tax=Paraglomus brasilianum TaxID=144538 RepID=A0A9N8ZKT5_9GLOM|nr:5681_t:CDS:10 [Paraglomus brasilianum]
MAACEHVLNTKLTPPDRNTQIHKEECTQCFDSQDLPQGIDVCLSCFNAGCLDNDRHHAKLHYQKTNHPLTLNIRRTVKEKRKRANDEEEPPLKISKLAIVPEAEEDKYEYFTKVKCYSCGESEIDKTSGILPIIIDSVMTSLSASKKSEIQAWEQEIVTCDHTRQLVQDPKTLLESQSLAHCNDCDLKENLWLCLTCGNLGCGRQQFGGITGNSHGVAHYEKTKHPVSCKLGTITPEGTADIFCYQCGESRLDPLLGQHLSNFGINVASQELEQNLKFDFSMVTEDGRQLDPLFGPGHTGIKNLGNRVEKQKNIYTYTNLLALASWKSCYMASVLQSIFSLDEFKQRYFPNATEHFVTCTNNPAECLQCQMAKMADGLLSGRYSNPVKYIGDDGKEQTKQEGIKPVMFKSLVGKGHEEFSTMRQQDAFEFFQHMVTKIERNEHATTGGDPTRIFKFKSQQRLQCTARKIENAEKKEGEEDQYEPISLAECLDAFSADNMVEYNCHICQKTTVALSNTRFLTFPEVLAVQMRRFEYVNYVPRKLGVPVIPPSGPINFDKYIGRGLQEGEKLLPEEQASEPQVNGAVLNELLLMGFPEIRCKKALIATDNRDAETALNWIFGHMDDPDIDAPIQTSKAAGQSASEPPEAVVANMMDMGFSRARAIKALKETNNNAERAVEWLFNHTEESDESMETENATQQFGDSTLPANYVLQCVISHKGTSVHCGHYVAHVQEDGQWVFFNDEKVVATSGPTHSEAYFYLLRRVR